MYGTAVNSLGLPTIVAVNLSDSTTQNIAVTWDGATPTYDANTVGTYAFSGSLAPSGNITNTKNLKASVNVIVVKQELPASAADVSGTIGDLIQNSTSSLLDGFWEFTKWIFGSGLKALSSVPFVQKASASLIQASTPVLSSLGLSN